MKKILFNFMLLFAILQPLQARDNTYGVAFNPLRAVALADDFTSLTGTLSYFDNTNGVEIAFPFFYEKDIKYDEYAANDTLFSMDIQYRKYLSEDTEGVYLGGLAKYSYLRGNASDRNLIATQHKFALGVVTGFRLNTEVGDVQLYWGANLSLGLYLNKESDIFSSDSTLILDDTHYVVDIELLKIGIEF